MVGTGRRSEGGSSKGTHWCWRSAPAFLGSSFSLRTDSAAHILSVAQERFAGRLPPLFRPHQTCLIYEVSLEPYGYWSTDVCQVVKKSHNLFPFVNFPAVSLLLSFTLCFVFIFLSSCSLQHLPVTPQPSFCSFCVFFPFCLSARGLSLSICKAKPF